MDERTEIQRKVLVEGASKRSIHRDYGIGHQPLAKILANAEPPGCQMAEERRKPVLGPRLATIEQILADDKEAPPKQRHTANRIFDRLRDEYGYTGCYSQVRTARTRPRRTPKRRSSRSLIHRATPSSTSVKPLRLSASAPRPSRPPTSPASSSSGRCRCGSPTTTPPSRSPR